MCPKATDSWYYKAAVFILFSHSSLSCFCQDVCGTNLWTKWGNGTILRNTLPKWGAVVFCLVLTESDPAFWYWMNISKLIHSVAPQIVVLKNQRGQWAKGGMRMNSWGWMNKVCLKFIFISKILLWNLQLKSTVCHIWQAQPAPNYSHFIMGVHLFIVHTRI